MAFTLWGEQSQYGGPFNRKRTSLTNFQPVGNFESGIPSDDELAQSSQPDPVKALDQSNLYESGQGPFSGKKKYTFDTLPRADSSQQDDQVEFSGPKPPTRLQDLQSQVNAIDHPQISTKARLMQALMTGLPTALGAIFGGQAGATGAAQGTTEALQQQRGIEEQRRNRLLEEMEAERNRQLQLQEHQMTTEAQRLALNAENQRAANAITAENTRAANTVAENKRYHDLLAKGRSESTEANLRGKGLQYDDEGNIVPVPRNLLSEKEQAELEFKDASTDLANARAEFEKSKNDPNSPQYKLALEKLNATTQRTQVALQRLGLSKDIFERDTYGTVSGQAIPGGPTDDSGKPIGLKAFNATKPTSTARSKAEQGQVVVDEGNRLIAEINNAKNIFGPAAGRISSLEVGMGSADPQTRELYTHLKSFAALQPALHGSRGIGMQKEFEDAAGKLQDNPQAAIAAIQSLMGTARSFMKSGGVSTPNRGGVPINRNLPDLKNNGPSNSNPATITMVGPKGTFKVTPDKVTQMMMNGYRQVGK